MGPPPRSPASASAASNHAWSSPRTARIHLRLRGVALRHRLLRFSRGGADGAGEPRGSSGSRIRGPRGELPAGLADGYNPTDSQLELTRAVKDWTPVRLLNCFQRLGDALMAAAVSGSTSRRL